MIPYSFRLMREADLPTVCVLEKQATDFPWGLQKIESSLLSKDDCWLCCIGDDEPSNQNILAFAIISTVIDESSLLNICTAVNYQHQGVATAFLRYLLHQASVLKVTKYFLEVRASNDYAIKLYQKFGFVKVGVRSGYYPASKGREDALVFLKDVNVM